MGIICRCLLKGMKPSHWELILRQILPMPDIVAVPPGVELPSVILMFLHRVNARIPVTHTLALYLFLLHLR